jgi:hypothetical protein
LIVQQILSPALAQHRSLLSVLVARESLLFVTTDLFQIASVARSERALSRLT